MKLYNSIFKVFLVTAMFFASSCETLDLDQTENPSAVNAALLDPTYAFNYIQLQLPVFVNSTNDFTQRVTRQMAMTGGSSYDNAFAPVNFNGHWSTGYTLLNAIKIMEPKAKEGKQNYILGASKVIRCYVLMTLVDVYGDIPYSQALEGSANITPQFDSSKSVYIGILKELDEAIATLQLPNSGTVVDLYYSSKDKWITLANTLKLKMYNNCNLLETIGSDYNVSNKINDIILSDNYIDTPAEDFVFRYSSSRQNPNTRHPMYNDQYELGGGAYIGNYMMWAMTTEKSFTTAFPNTIDDPGDPRVNFYFYRQDPNPGNDDNFVLPGRTRPEHYNETRYSSFYSTSIGACYTVSNWIGGALPANGFWGRDHGNNSGIPQDSDKRSVAGVYPIGGAYGGYSAGTVQTQGTKGAKGAGIMPILLSSWVHFMKAEAIMKGKLSSGDAKAEMMLAITQSIEKTTSVIPVTPAISPDDLADIATKKQKYLDFISTTYDGLNDAKKLELLIKEFYIATWGNGIEPYNNYRRTGYPSNFQPTLEPISGAFYNCAFYAGNCVNNNPNAPVNDRSRKVFWAEPNNIVLH